ncbi:Uncharacterized protein ChrSV_3809 [Chromobacterium vaccinii]|nr:Uncharacterized protein ChrSW_3809 [Chromobacterium vaccinii]QND91266.1 Uncharacterized protein ChrSV_3809 [Chromobacterium vaccinii]
MNRAGRFRAPIGRDAAIHLMQGFNRSLSARITPIHFPMTGWRILVFRLAIIRRQSLASTGGFMYKQ